MTPIKLREVKSFVRRHRRLTENQEKLFETLWPTVGLAAPTEKFDFTAIFGRSSEKICEIGFGHGDTISVMAKNNPDKDYVGIEVHEPGVAELLQYITDHHLKNVRIISDDAVKIFENHIPDNTFSRIHIYFPDPWPKKKHHKRRLVSSDFVSVLTQKLAPGGFIHCATDWQHYAEQMMSVLSAADALKNAVGEHLYADNQALQLRANTKFERRGMKLGHGVWDLLFYKK